MQDIVIGVVLELKEIEGSLKYLINSNYIEAIVHSMPKGGRVILKKITYEDTMEKLNVDGIVLIGGGIFAKSVKNKPSLYEANPQRYNFEKSLLEYCYEKKLPVLGICRGFQMMNEVFGGNVDYIKINSKVNHQAKVKHTVKLLKNSLLEKIYKKSVLLVNSAHHKHITTVSDNFIISAVSEDGLIEAIESKFKPFFMGVQWHPEALEEADSNLLFKYFLKYCLDMKLDS